MSLTVRQTDENTADGFFRLAHAVQNTRRSHQEIAETESVHTNCFKLFMVDSDKNSR